MDWLMINNNSGAMGEILGLGVHSIGNSEAINPRLLASKFAYAVFPGESELNRFSMEKRKAPKPDLRWTKAEIGLLAPAKVVPAASAEGALIEEAAPIVKSEEATPVEAEGAEAPAPRRLSPARRPSTRTVRASRAQIGQWWTRRAGGDQASSSSSSLSSPVSLVSCSAASSARSCLELEVSTL